MSKIEFYDSSWPIGRGYSIIQHRRYKPRWGEELEWIAGEVITPDGIVFVMAQSNPNLSRLDYAFEGRVYSRSYRKRYSSRWLVTKAKQFAREIVEGGEG